VPFTEVADDVWVARYDWFDVNVSLVRGRSGLLVVDTHASARAAQQVVEDVRALGAGEVVAVVNTHEHFDHTFGNATFRAAYGAVPVHAHEVAAAQTVPAGQRVVLAGLQVIGQLVVGDAAEGGVVGRGGAPGVVGVGGAGAAARLGRVGRLRVVGLGLAVLGHAPVLLGRHR
jgi:glyoxylase-like metal-dependent hydrolase (beta-lactamase superfamily II)